MNKTLSSEDILNAALDYNLVPDNYFTGWTPMQEWQMNTLKQLGLKPQHTLLDVGCGALRLGLSAIQYLESGHYFGVDAYESYIRLGKALAARSDLQKEFHIECDSEFRFTAFGIRFDFAMAQSVLTHLSIPQMKACFQQLQSTMKPQGKFVFTYIVGDYPTLGFLYGGTHLMQRGWILSDRFLETSARECGATFEKLSLSHPTGQRVGLFTYPNDR